MEMQVKGKPGVHAESLHAELMAHFKTRFGGVVHDGENLTLHFDGDLSKDDLSTAKKIIATHNPKLASAPALHLLKSPEVQRMIAKAKKSRNVDSQNLAYIVELLIQAVN